MENNYKLKKIDKMPSNDKPLLILDSKNKLRILYKEWKERDSFEKWFKLCTEEDIKKWCYFEMDGMNYFDGVLKQNACLQSELDKTIKQLIDYEKALKDYANGDFYEADVNLQTNPLTNKEEVFSVDIQDKKGNVIYTKAQETLKKWEE